MADSYSGGRGSSGERQSGRSESERPARRTLLMIMLLVAAAAALPSFRELDSALISDDGAALGYVQREGAGADWFGPQYDLRTVRFWRPMVSMSLGLQEATTGVRPQPLKLFNLLGHMLAACLVAAIARRMGATPLGTLLAGLAAAFFPYQGGNVLWVVGRVDSGCLPLLLGAVLLGTSERTGWRMLGLIPAFLAFATKEIAFALVPWIAVLNWGRGITMGRSLLRTAPFALLMLLVLIWRRIALGVWIGGYPVQGIGAGEAWGDRLSLPAGVGAVLGWPLLFWGLAVATLFFLGALGQRKIFRPSLAAAMAALAGLLPLAHLFLAPEVGQEHLRTFWLADCGLVLGISILVGNRSQLGWAATAEQPSRGGANTVGHTLVLSIVVTFVLVRASSAQDNVMNWRRAADAAGAKVAALAASVSGEEARAEPIMATDIPRTLNGAYVLQWGVADRFRAPFPETSRPIWPWRPLFTGGAQDERSAAWPIADACFRPFDSESKFPLLDATRVSAGTATEREVELETGPPFVLSVDESLLLAPGQADPSAKLLLRASADVHAWELLLISELGYQVAGLPAAGGRQLEISLRDALMSAGRVPLWMALAQAADFGADRAYLEFRALDAKRQPIFVSRWIGLTWSPELRDVVYPLEGQ